MPVYCFAANVAGDLAEVENLLPANVGPHDYNPTQSDYEKIRKADLFVVNGLKLEDWLQKMLKSRRNRQGLTVVEVSRGLDAQLIRQVPAIHLDDAGGHKHDHGTDANPHIWLDPVLAAHAVTNILVAFQKADPAHATGYAANAAAYVIRLQALHREFSEGLSQSKGVPFVAYHDAFVYLARRYQLNIAGVIEEVPEVTPSLKYQASLKRLIKKEGIRVIFAEPQFPSRIAEQLSSDTGVPLGFLDTMETAASGRLAADSYEVGMRENLKVLSRHLK